MTGYTAPFIPFAITDAQGRPTGQFQQFWKSTFEDAVANAEAAADAQTSASGAQGTANGAMADAATAQATADSALVLASAAVQQDVGPAWADATGAALRTALAALTAPLGPFTVSNPPTQAEVRAIGDALVTVSTNQVAISQHLVGIINDLFANKALTNP